MGWDWDPFSKKSFEFNKTIYCLQPPGGGGGQIPMNSMDSRPGKFIAPQQ